LPSALAPLSPPSASLEPKLNASPTDPAPSLPVWFRWAQLVRIPTVFTVIAQVLAAFVVAAGTGDKALAAWPLAVLILAAAIAAYWAGMILNDIWDLAEDTLERPSRPLPSGAISVSAARTAGWTLLVLAIAIAGLAGWFSTADQPLTFAPPVIAAALAIGVVLYNGPLKRTPLAPLMMGLCRMLCFLLGASPLMMVGTAEFMQPQTWFPMHVLGFAAGFGVYITGITTISRGETAGGNRSDLITGLVTSVLGAALLAVSPRLAPADTPWAFLPDGRFAILVGLITLPIVLRGIRTLSDPQPLMIQLLIRSGILNLIPYSAVIALITAGMGWALAIFALAFAATITSARFRVT
jgi:4-hydroxybenzoate polyprenyltransferase